MQISVPSRQNHLQNTLSLAIFMLIICYYVFNGMPKVAEMKQISVEENTHVVLETNISHLRATVLMDADMVQIQGDLYAVENSLEVIVGSKKAQKAIQEIHEKLLLNDKKSAVRLINELPTLFLK